jgi:competence transcription factor ComK
MVTEVKSVITEKLKKKKRKNEEITRVDKILLYECDCEIFQFGRFKAACRMCRLFFFGHARIGNKEEKRKITQYL